MCEKFKDGDYREVDTVRGQMGYKLNIRYQSKSCVYITGRDVTVTWQTCMWYTVIYSDLPFPKSLINMQSKLTGLKCMQLRLQTQNTSVEMPTFQQVTTPYRSPKGFERSVNCLFCLIH